MSDTLIQIGIITAPRPRPTIAKSLLSLELAGFQLIDAMVFADGPCDLDGVSVYRNAVPLGNKGNWVNALRTMIVIADSGQYPYPWMMVCEDDITWVPNCAERLIAELDRRNWDDDNNRRVRCISLYLPRRHSKAHGLGLMPGYHFEGMQHGRKTWGAQCYLFRRDWAKALLSNPLFQHYADDPKKDKNIDGIIGECINNAGHVIAFRVPCLVNHVMGEANSSLGYPPVRPDLQTDYWRGRA